MKRIHIVDIDDTLAPFASAAHAKAHEMGLHDDPEGALRVWHGWEQYGCSHDEWLQVFIELAKDNYYTTVQPYPGAIEALRDLQWEGDEVHLVTARGFMDLGDEIRAWTQEWKEEFAVPGTLTFAKDKGRIALALGATHGIDDGFHNWVDLTRVGVDCYLMNQPHNATAEPTVRDWRIDSVADYAALVLKEDA